MESTDNGASNSEKNKPLEQSVEDLSKGPPSSVPKSRHLTIKYVGHKVGSWENREFSPHTAASSQPTQGPWGW